MPKDTWIDTVHFAKIEGGQVSNVISNYAEALLDFRLTENSTVEHLEENLNKCMESGVTYKIVSSSTPVVMDPDNKYIQAYKKLAEEVLGEKCSLSKSAVQPIPGLLPSAAQRLS